MTTNVYDSLAPPARVRPVVMTWSVAPSNAGLIVTPAGGVTLHRVDRHAGRIADGVRQVVGDRVRRVRVGHGEGVGDRPDGGHRVLHRADEVLLDRRPLQRRVDEGADAFLADGERDARQDAGERHHGGGAGDPGQGVSGRRSTRRACTAVPAGPRSSARPSIPGRSARPARQARRRRGRRCGEGPVAGTAVPPLSLMTCLIRISAAVSLTAVQRTDRPMKTMTPPLRPSAKPGIDVAVGVDLHALPAHRRARDRDGVGAGPLHVARVAAGLGQRVPRSRGHQRADTGGPGRPCGRAGRRGRAQRPGGRQRPGRLLTLLTRVSRVVQVTGLVIMNAFCAGGQRRGVREAPGSSRWCRSRTIVGVPSTQPRRPLVTVSAMATVSPWARPVRSDPERLGRSAERQGGLEVGGLGAVGVGRGRCRTWCR